MKNIAYMRKVFHSSKFDKNSAGHIVTVGKKSEPENYAFNIYDEYNDALESVWNIIDDQSRTRWVSLHDNTYFEIKFDKPVCAKAYRLMSNMYDKGLNPSHWVLSASLDGVNFVELDTRSSWMWDESESRNMGYFYLSKEPIIYIDNDVEYIYYRITALKTFEEGKGTSVGGFELIGTDGKSLLKSADTHTEFYWKSETGSNEYLLLDLGAESSIKNVKLFWGNEYAEDYEIMYSRDGKEYVTCYKTVSGKGGNESIDISLESITHLKLCLNESSGEHFILKEWQVWGENTFNYALPEAPKFKNGKQYLRNGNWKLARANEITLSGEELSLGKICDGDWIPATVPGTVLTSFVNAGAVWDNIKNRDSEQQSDAYFTADWWYTNHFIIGKQSEFSRVFLNFDAIDWKADIFFNGKYLGDVAGAFMRGKFDITDFVRYGEENYLAVLIHRNDFPGANRPKYLDDVGFLNGGVIGLDEPCLAAGIGWDWINTIPGRNIGIYKDVYLSFTNQVELCDPWVETVTDVTEESKNAVIALHTGLKNYFNAPCEVCIKGKIIQNDIHFEKKLVLDSGEKIDISLNDIIIENPKLWYPNGYGEASLYNMELKVEIDGILSDKKNFNFGIRTFKYEMPDGILKIFCNGKHIVCVGGNWGMDDANMRCTAESYDIKVLLHKDMGLNIIRNWVGQTNDVAFYEACDRHGIMVWDEFWLANPCDGPNPLNPDMFMKNAEDKVRKVRRHPCIVLYCARNEGYPKPPLDTLIPEMLERLDKTRLYIPHSSEGVVSGYGPYDTRDREFYFKETPKTIHSERGCTNIPCIDSMKEFLSKENLWPINENWAAHDFFFNGAQNCRGFLERVEGYGKCDSVESFVKKAQMVDYITFKSIFEATRFNESNGMIYWMSISAQPSFNFHTFDYYYAINGGYMGTKISNQVILAYLNPLDRSVWADTRSTEMVYGTNVFCGIYSLEGEVLNEVTVSADIGRERVHITDIPNFEKSVLLKLEITDSNGNVLSRNFDWIFGNDNAFADMAKTEIKIIKKDDSTIKIKNIGKVSALQVCLTLRDSITNKSILPVLWEDNYISLLPNEERTISFKPYKTPEVKTFISAEGFNVDYVTTADD